MRDHGDSFFIFCYKYDFSKPNIYYEIVFFIDGEWQIVIVDDYFPTKYNEFVFAQPNGSELWVILLEKAWAKVNGGYINTIGGVPQEALTVLSSFVGNSFRIEDMREDFFNKILKNSQD